MVTGFTIYKFVCWCFGKNLTNVSVTETTPYVFKSLVVHTRLLSLFFLVIFKLYMTWTFSE
jgi:hypothetical protein